MKRYGILAAAIIGLAISSGAQSSTSSQSDASVQTQTNASANASAGSPHQSKAGSSNEGNSPSKSASASGSSSAAAGANANSLSIPSGTPIPATLITPLDAKKNKPGDPVVARTTQDVKQGGQVLLKKGSTLKGHVTQAQPRSGASSQSALGVVFDNAIPKNSRQPVPLNLSVQALAGATNQASSVVGDEQGTFASSDQTGFAGSGIGTPAGGGVVRGAGGAIGGVGSTVGGVTGTTGGVAGNAGQAINGTVGSTTQTVASAGSTGGLDAPGQLMSTSTGVFSLQGLNLTSATSNGTQGSIVNSTSRNVHLDNGTQMMLQVIGQ